MAAVLAGAASPRIAREILTVQEELGLGFDCYVGPASLGPEAEAKWAADGAAFPCKQLFMWPNLPYYLWLGLVLLLITVVFVLAARRVGQPISELIKPINRLGPQNLGYRIDPDARQDDVTRLARAIDSMMDRITVGYDAQRRFAADASHELRTPLAIQRTLIEVGLPDAVTPEAMNLLAGQLLATNEHSERLIEGLLVLSETDRGLQSRTPVRLDEVVASIVAEHRPLAADAGIVLTTHLRPRVVTGERVLLERLVTNLMVNAIKYNRPNGGIHVETGDEPTFTITNTGDDVPAEAVSRLFEPFQRLTGTRLDHSGGVGLGLSIVRSIVRAHSGTVSAQSTGTDGLRIDISLPGPD
ncbi:sensor histidine kinase [Micromonospora chokoriensis]